MLLLEDAGAFGGLISVDRAAGKFWNGLVVVEPFGRVVEGWISCLVD